MRVIEASGLLQHSPLFDSIEGRVFRCNTKIASQSNRAENSEFILSMQMIELGVFLSNAVSCTAMRCRKLKSVMIFAVLTVFVSILVFLLWTTQRC